MSSEAELRTAYKSAGQGHVFDGWEGLGEAERETLLSDLRSFDPQHIFGLLQAPEWQSGGAVEAARAHGSVAGASPEELRAWEAEGLAAVAAGKLAVVLLAGGQGTRLGSSQPKGMFDAGLPSGKSLFQLQAERLAALWRLAGAGAPCPPWYVMTSEATGDATRAFFRAHAHFGLPPSAVTFFDQGSLPCLSPGGKVLLCAPGRVARAPDGNGALFHSLRRSGALDDMADRGVESVYVYCVDNLVVRLGDPALVGFCRLRGAAAGAKVIPKAYPEEPVGVYVTDPASGALRVVEYSELPPSLAVAVGGDGELRYNAANIAIHYFSLPFLETCARQARALRYHSALKRVPCLAEPAPAAPNALKLESFIFDVYPFAPPERVSLLQGVREADFSPIKNASGKDSAATAARLLDALHRRWAAAAGARVEGEGVFELSAALTYGGEGLERLAGRAFTAPVHVASFD